MVVHGPLSENGFSFLFGPRERGQEDEFDPGLICTAIPFWMRSTTFLAYSIFVEL